MAARIVLNWSRSGQAWAQNVIHGFVPSALIDQSYAEDLRDVIDTAWDTVDVQDVLANTVALDSVTVSDLDENNPDHYIAEFDLEGVSSQHLIPANVSLVVTLQTIGGHPNGRVFQWGFSEAENGVDGRPSELAITRTLAFWDAVRVGMIGMGAEMGQAVLSRRTGTQTLGAVTGVRRSPSASSQGWQTQRRRSDGIAI